MLSRSSSRTNHHIAVVAAGRADEVIGVAVAVGDAVADEAGVVAKCETLFVKNEEGKQDKIPRGSVVGSLLRKVHLGLVGHGLGVSGSVFQWEHAIWLVNA